MSKHVSMFWGSCFSQRVLKRFEFFTLQSSNMDRSWALGGFYRTQLVISDSICPWKNILRMGWYHFWLVVCLPLWKSNYQSVGMIIPNIWKNKKCSKPPTRFNDHLILYPMFYPDLSPGFQKGAEWLTEFVQAGEDALFQLVLAHIPICEFLLIHDLPSWENPWSNMVQPHNFSFGTVGVFCRVSLRKSVV